MCTETFAFVHDYPVYYLEQLTKNLNNFNEFLTTSRFSSKYFIKEEKNGFKIYMSLLIHSFNSNDVGTYNCVSTNSLGKAEGTLRLYGTYLITFFLHPSTHLPIHPLSYLKFFEIFEILFHAIRFHLRRLIYFSCFFFK